MLKRNDSVSDLLSKFDDSKRTVAKLMARENITVNIDASADTARFDTVSRVLTIPNWSSMTVAQADLLLGHEIGHALFSDNSYLETLAQNRDKRGLFHYINVIEDTRIERKMKNAFPGLARVFYDGYNAFHQNGPIFKGDKSSIELRDGRKLDVNTMKFIDRINLHYKVGAFMTIPFSATEKSVLARIDRCSSMQDAIQIAKDLYAAAKEKDTTPQQSQSGDDSKPSKSDKSDKSDATESDKSDATESDKSDATESDKSDSADAEASDDANDDDKDSTDSVDADENDSDTDDSDADGDTSNGDADSDEQDDDADGDADGPGNESDDDSDADGNSDESDDESDSSDAGNGAGNGEGEDDPTSETAEDMDAGLREAAKNAPASPVRHLLAQPMPDNVVREMTVTARQYVALMDEYIASQDKESDVAERETAWKDRYATTAQLMAQEFNRRKNARQRQNKHVAKTGKLNVDKLHAYKFSQDIFTRSVTMPRGQSHGIVMLIDGSGSMNGVFADVLDQTMLLANFAFNANIPFEAYMFIEEHAAAYGADRYVDMPLHTITIMKGMKLVGLFNTTDRGSFKRQMRTVLTLQSAFDRSNSRYYYGSYRGMPYANLGGTPLYSGMMLAERHVCRMKNTLKLDQMTFVVVSDGGDGSGLHYKTNTADPAGYITAGMNAIHHHGGGIVLRDTVTKKNFVYIETSEYYGASRTMLPEGSTNKMMFDLIAARHNARTIHMFIADVGPRRRRRGSYNSAIVEATKVLVDRTVKGTVIDQDVITETLHTEGCMTVPAPVADLGIILSASKLALTEDEFEKLDASKMSAKQVTREFTKSMTGRVANRKFVAAVMPFIA